MDAVHQKMETLNRNLQEMGSAAVAFSGGVDSTFLLAAAQNALGEHLLAVTAQSCSFPKRELEETTAFCTARRIRHIIVQSEELDIEGFRSNPTNRCYLCKHELFEKVLKIAADNQIHYVAEGSNQDDLGTYRPGLQAIAELGIRSPLREVGLTKDEIRLLSKEMGLPTWDKPSFACLASRFPYGETISEEKLRMVDYAEEYLQGLGFRQVRVRIHGTLARIEVHPDAFTQISAHRMEIAEKLHSFGFTYVCVDLQGYRTGSMNETLKKEEASRVN